jgi:hypothetical protein
MKVQANQMMKDQERVALQMKLNQALMMIMTTHLKMMVMVNNLK